MTTKIVIDLMESYVKVARMAEAYNAKHGTKINAFECVKQFGSKFINHPKFGFLNPKGFEFAVAILEGNPVFVGCELYSHKGELCKVTSTQIDILSGDHAAWNYAHAAINCGFTWTKPQPKRTFEINGEVLPCPVINETNHQFTLEGGSSGFWTFFFESSDDRSKVLEKFVKDLRKARDKEAV